MNPSEQEDLMRLIQQIRDRFKLTILLVEHNMKVVMGVCERIQVVDYGKSIALGIPDEIRNDPKVIEQAITTDDPKLRYAVSWGGPESQWTDQALQAFDQAFQDVFLVRLGCPHRFADTFIYIGGERPG